MTVIRVTIDSNVVLDCFERPDRYPEARELIDLHPHRVRLQVANRTPDREATSWASALDTLQVERQTNLIRLGMWQLGGPDILAGDDDVLRGHRLQEIVFPEGIPAVESDASFGKFTDIDILDAHIRSGADYFVTRDAAILATRDTLRDEFAVEVMTTTEVLARLSPGFSP